MKEIVTTNYFWGQDVEMSQFYRVPKALYTGEYFRGISFEAKAIYGMMIDRVSLSIKNGWLDEDGKTYIHYSVADIMADTGCGKNKILKCLKELEEDVSLIERKKQGQGRPDIIYVKNFAIEEVEESPEKKNTTKVYNIKAYLLAALFNAGATMSNYYRAEVNHDMPQFAG